MAVPISFTNLATFQLDGRGAISSMLLLGLHRQSLWILQGCYYFCSKLTPFFEFLHLGALKKIGHFQRSIRDKPFLILKNIRKLCYRTFYPEHFSNGAFHQKKTKKKQKNKIEETYVNNQFLTFYNPHLLKISKTFDIGSLVGTF